MVTMRMILFVVTCGRTKRYFPNNEEAKKYSKYLMEHEDDGIPFIHSVTVEHKRDVCNLLNGETL